jgi:lysophospholipase L1-like esterase
MSFRTLLTAVIVAVASLSVVCTAHAAGRHAAPRYYLALGDSLSTGVQPGPTGAVANTKQGYANDVFAYERKYVPGLKLVQMGCPGDGTATMLTGQGNTGLAKYFHCDRQGGSQLAAAVAFLKAHHHRGEVPLVTVNIGTNDIGFCTTASDLGTCISGGLGTINAELPKILSALRAAAPAGTKFAGMTLYDAYLSNYLLPAGNPSQPLASASVAPTKQVNEALASTYASAHFKVANVAAAFDTYDSRRTVTWYGQSVPRSLALLCAWTWNCAPPPVGPNIHPNQLGYQVIAQAFEKAVGKL